MSGAKATLPVVFATDMGPDPALIDEGYARTLKRVGRELPKPKAILVMSGHWLAGKELWLTSSTSPETIHDFSGFSPELHELQYPCAGAPEVAERAARLLENAGLRASLDPKRGLDHGAWAPLRRLFPAADIPVVQLTVPAGWSPAAIADVGRAVKPLREEGVLLVAAGNLLHNLRRFAYGSDEVFSWAAEFDAWLEPRLESGKAAELAAYRTAAPHAKLAAPTTEHFDPLFFALGAAEGERFRLHHRSLTMGSALSLLFTLGQS